MDKNTILNILSRFRSVLETNGVTVNRMILFGSYANGTFKEGSDIDVVVVSENFEGKNFWKRTNILSDAIYEIFEPIEVVAMTPEEWERGNSDIRDFAREGEEVKI
ncbi:MAG: nucleotidyltransferase domain-containing protein [Candidatus Latescibacteria bacterium]|nr:nucleotidyltransferase domain-containing protein [Candidatus Latescibacterota bacterium]